MTAINNSEEHRLEQIRHATTNTTQSMMGNKTKKGNVIMHQICIHLSGSSSHTSARREKDDRCTGKAHFGMYCAEHMKTVLGLSVNESQIPGSGSGLWSEKTFKKGDIIGGYVGQVIRRKAAAKSIGRDNHYVIENIEAHSDGEGQYFIDASATNTNVTRMMNDSLVNEYNNAEFVGAWDGSVVVKARRDISSKEEIMASYGPGFWPKQNSEIVQEQDAPRARRRSMTSAKNNADKSATDDDMCSITSAPEKMTPIGSKAKGFPGGPRIVKKADGTEQVEILPPSSAPFLLPAWKKGEQAEHARNARDLKNSGELYDRILKLNKQDEQERNTVQQNVQDERAAIAAATSSRNEGEPAAAAAAAASSSSSLPTHTPSGTPLHVGPNSPEYKSTSPMTDEDDEKGEEDEDEEEEDEDMEEEK